MYLGPEVDVMFTWMFRFAIFGALCGVVAIGFGLWFGVPWLLNHVHVTVLP